MNSNYDETIERERDVRTLTPYADLRYVNELIALAIGCSKHLGVRDIEDD